MAEYVNERLQGTAIGGGPHEFSLNVRAFADRVEARRETVVRRVLMDIFRELVEATPRDTGYAQSCWAVDPASYPPVNLARGGPGPYSPRFAEGEAAIRSFRVGDGLVGYIYNNCRYIIPLEYGHSSQAPAPYGIARKVLTRFDSYLASAAGGT
jgi:hypothetical protein